MGISTILTLFYKIFPIESLQWSLFVIFVPPVVGTLIVHLLFKLRQRRIQKKVEIRAKKLLLCPPQAMLEGFKNFRKSVEELRDIRK